MCRSIRPLFNVNPPASGQDVMEAAVQFIRKVSGFRNPSRANQEAFDRAVEDVAAATQRLLESLVTRASRRLRA